MTKLLWPAVAGTAILILTLLAFMHLAAAPIDQLKYAAVIFYVVATAAVFWRMTRSMNLAALLGLAVAIALLSGLVQWLLRYWHLIETNDVEVTGWGYLIEAGFAAAVTAAWYGLVAVAAYAASSLGAAMRRGHR
jgi:hypothetical protein